MECQGQNMSTQILITLGDVVSTTSQRHCHVTELEWRILKTFWKRKCGSNQLPGWGAGGDVISAQRSHTHSLRGLEEVVTIIDHNGNVLA